MTVRNAREEDSLFIARMIMMALHIPEEGNAELSAKLFNLVNDRQSLYYWGRCRIAEESAKYLGLCLSYDGVDYHERRMHSFDIDQPDESGPGEWYVDSLAVVPEARGKGIGRKLVVDSVGIGLKRGLTPTILVDPKNSPAVSLYESVGFCYGEDIFVFGQTYHKMKIRRD